MCHLENTALHEKIIVRQSFINKKILQGKNGDENYTMEFIILIRF